MDKQTVAGLLLLGVVLALTLPMIALIINYSSVAILNSTRGFEAAFNTTNATYTTVKYKVGNQTAEILYPNDTLFSNSYKLVSLLAILLARIVSNPIALAALVGASIVVAALVTRSLG